MPVASETWVALTTSGVSAIRRIARVAVSILGSRVSQTRCVSQSCRARRASRSSSGARMRASVSAASSNTSPSGTIRSLKRAIDPLAITARAAPARSLTARTNPSPASSRRKSRVLTPTTRVRPSSKAMFTQGSERISMRCGSWPRRSQRPIQKHSTRSARAGSGAKVRASTRPPLRLLDTRPRARPCPLGRVCSSMAAAPMVLLEMGRPRPAPHPHRKAPAMAVTVENISESSTTRARARSPAFASAPPSWRWA